MSRFKLVLLGLVAALTVSAVGSASAFAKSCETNGPHLAFCFDSNVEIGTPPQEALGVSGESLLEGKVGGAGLQVKCAKDKFVGELELLGQGKGTITFETCEVEKPANCTVAQPINATFKSELTTLTEAKFRGSKTGEEFTTLKIESASCTLKGEYTVTGKQGVELPKGGELLVEHEVIATKAKSTELKLGVESASFRSTALVHLGSPHLGLTWSTGMGT